MKEISPLHNKNNIITQPHELGNIQASLDYFLKFNIPQNAKILDLGCNYGSLIFNLYSIGYQNVYGIDINPDSIEKGKNNYSLIADKLNVHQPGTTPFYNNEFDVILMFDVIEHVPNIKTFIKNEVWRILKPGGLFIFQTPNKLINIPWEIISKKSWTKWKEYHCSLQTIFTLQQLLSNADFNDLAIEKGNVLTQHNITKVNKIFGPIGAYFLHMLQKFPLTIYPNFWGSAKKPLTNTTIL